MKGARKRGEGVECSLITSLHTSGSALNVGVIKMNPRFKGLGFLLLLIPVLAYIPLRLILGDWEETHHSRVVSVTLVVSGAFAFFIANLEDKKSGIDALSRRAWTSRFLKPQHIRLHVPLRLAAIVLLCVGAVVAFL